MGTSSIRVQETTCKSLTLLSPFSFKLNGLYIVGFVGSLLNDMYSKLHRNIVCQYIAFLGGFSCLQCLPMSNVKKKKNPICFKYHTTIEIRCMCYDQCGTYTCTKFLLNRTHPPCSTRHLSVVICRMNGGGRVLFSPLSPEIQIARSVKDYKLPNRKNILFHHFSLVARETGTNNLSPFYKSPTKSDRRREYVLSVLGQLDLEIN